MAMAFFLHQQRLSEVASKKPLLFQYSLCSTIIIMWGEVGASTSPVFQRHVLLLVNLFRGFDLSRRQNVEHDTMLLGCGGRLRYSHWRRSCAGSPAEFRVVRGIEGKSIENVQQTLVCDRHHMTHLGGDPSEKDGGLACSGLFSTGTK